MSALGLAVFTESKYLLWLNVCALVVALAFLYRGNRERGKGPFLLGGAAALAIVLGKFVFASSAASWIGAGAIFAATVWSNSAAAKQDRCPQCSTTSKEMTSNGD